MVTPKLTPPYLTRYERAKVLSVRAQQLSVGKLPKVEVPLGHTTHLEVAFRELVEKKIPNHVVRVLPNGRSETWAVRDLINLFD